MLLERGIRREHAEPEIDRGDRSAPEVDVGIDRDHLGLRGPIRIGALGRMKDRERDTNLVRERPDDIVLADEPEREHGRATAHLDELHARRRLALGRRRARAAIVDLNLAVEPGVPREPPEEQRDSRSGRRPRIRKRVLAGRDRRLQQRRRATTRDELAEHVEEALAGLQVRFRGLGHSGDRSRPWPSERPRMNWLTRPRTRRRTAP